MPDFGLDNEELQLSSTMDGKKIKKKKKKILTDGVLCTTNSKYELHRDFESKCKEDGTVVH